MKNFTQLQIEIPDGFHTLGLEGDDAYREDCIREMADLVWSEGTDLQRDTMAAVYDEMAGTFADDGAFYAGVCFVGMEDDRVSTASVVARLDDTDATDADLVATGLAEALSHTTTDVSVTRVPAGPCVVSFHGSEWVPAEGAEPLGIARVDAQIPVPSRAQLLTLSLSTPSLTELPVYVNLLRLIAETVAVVDAESPSDASDPGAEVVTGQRNVADEMRSTFG
ncbi:hypothetical protein [Streptomyces monomycini]|uniref:hypothetical protein n=1 Tax=Streptomyces monomycini TaxID=371720 RepID=UPI00067C4C76|nr:hypothetical protein [Streptomyces monomycini]